MSANTKDPIIGRTLGDFLVKEKLGEGGFGAVYKADQITLGREAVVKILHTRHRTNPRIIERFKREAHLASRLEHPYCAHIYSFGAEIDGLLWIAMELVQGTPLSEIIKFQGPLSLERFVPLLDKICEVVHTAHDAGIIHRDLKPANVMVISRAGRLLPKLLDFGIAKGLSQSALVDNFASKTSLPSSQQDTVDSIDYPSLEDSIGKQTITVINDKKITINSNTIDNLLKNENTIINNLLKNEETVIENSTKNEETVIESFTDKETIIKNNGNNQKIEQRKFTINLDTEESTNINKQANTAPKPHVNKTQSENTFKTQGFIGSPPYMPPEQWQNGANVDARSDIYSLGILAYQVLTGELPFKEQGFELYGAHISKAVPALKASFPVALNQVLQKALAKSSSERYQTALEFAKSFRQAADFNEQKIDLPAIDDILKENILANAPKPLADTVASLIASRNAYQFRDRVLLVFRVLVHYIGILSLASHTSILNRQEDNELVSKLISNLRQEGLNQSQWLELAKELCRPFDRKPDAYPIPELVSLFFTFDSGQPLTEVFSKLLDLQQEIASISSLKEEQLVNLLDKFLDKLTILLKATTWLSDYYLVLPQEQDAIKWMGISSDTNTIILKNSNLTSSKAVLVDANGYFVLSLWPLVEISSPTAGTSKEVFLLERKGRNAAKLVSYPDGFEIETQAPWEWLKEHFFTNEEKSQTGGFLEKSPYLGLTSFSATDSNLFFGREKETESFLNRLRIQPLIAVVGPSGAGKSSFVQAGVIAGLTGDWRVLTIRPGLSPITTLYSKLSKIGVEFTNLKSQLEENINILAKTLHGLASKENCKVLLVIDQFEEIFTLCSDKKEQKLYVEAIVSCAKSEEDPIRVILTIRDDFLVRAKELSGLKDRLTQGLEILTTPDSTQLLRILTEPARRVGYSFEDQELPVEIVNSVAEQTSALPLLAFTAEKLWQQRDKEFKQLLRRSYQAMGGVVGALAKHAEEVLQQMTKAEQSLVREALNHLVTSEGTRAALSHPELLQLLGNNSDSEAVIEKLISARLLVTIEGEKGVDRIEVVHEALFSAWPRLVNWQQEMAEGARLRDQIRVAARQWQERGRPNGLLWRDEALVEYQIWRERYKTQLTDIEQAFASTSLMEANRRQKVKRNLIAAAMIILLIGSSVLYYQRYQTKQQLLQTLKLYEEQGRQEMLRGNLEGAAVYLSEAYSKGADSITLKYMLAVAMAKAENRSAITLSDQVGTMTTAIFSPDDSLVVTTSRDKTARIWQASTGKELFTLKGHTDTVIFSSFSPDGKFLVTASLDNTARVWKVDDGTLVTTLTGHTDGLHKAIFSPDAKQILTISYDTTAKIWNPFTGNLIYNLTGHQASINAACYSKDSKLIATASTDKLAKIWDSQTGKLKTTLTGHQAALLAISFSPDAKLIATGSADKTTNIWQVTDGKLLSTLKEHTASVTDAEFSPDGKNILTTSADNKARIWQTENSNLIFTLEGHKADIFQGEFSPDGKLIITSSYDGTLRVWDRNSGKFLVALTEHKESLNSGIFSSNGEKILTASEDKTTKIWSLIPEERSPQEVSKIVTEKVPFYLEEGRLISKIINNSNKTENVNNIMPVVERNNENVFVEDLGNDISLEMVKITGSTFEMGSPIDEKGHGGDEILHKVTLSNFYIGKYEITQAQWKIIASLPKIKRSLSIDPSQFKGDNLPVQNVAWDDAVEFCARLSKLTGKNYRLPTEAEWEYAARAGTTGPQAGDLDKLAWYNKSSTSPPNSVGQMLPNAWGLYDMHGNVWEWCQDWYGDYPKELLIDPKGPVSGLNKVVRGSNWYGSIPRSADRSYLSPNDKGGDDLGFRVVFTK
ncbi:MAG: SUMF1/EgtB/PvdO family nonheme iron enzyme [Blastocatellia bacterium]